MGMLPEILKPTLILQAILPLLSHILIGGIGDRPIGMAGLISTSIIMLFSGIGGSLGLRLASFKTARWLLSLSLTTIREGVGNSSGYANRYVLN